MALLHLAADWARAKGRRLLALTVDHGLNPDSPDWTAVAERAALAAGADWRGLPWTGPKPATGLPAAARTARHRLIAEAAREAGARVVLFGHTATDIAEGELMRDQGSTLGRLREWSPSPAWPEGRGLMLLRPMLDAGREDVRQWLAGQGATWLDDPGNDDPRFARSRARQALTLLPMGEGGPEGRMRVDWMSGEAAPGQSPLTLSRKDDRFALVRSSPLLMGEGSINIDRLVDAPTLAAVLVCAGGSDRLPRGDRLATILARLHSSEAFTATLCGTRVEASVEHVLVTRESGEFLRRPRPPLALSPGLETVWDGRWGITVDVPGWSVAPAAGRMASLSDADRAVLKALPPAARGSLPVLIRNDATAPVLAGTAGRATSLVEERLALALDRMTHERDLGGTIHGALLPNHLFSEVHH
jgi:tRNA(Ile)-lysidine synthase